jgi:hypothetical protein
MAAMDDLRDAELADGERSMENTLDALKMKSTKISGFLTCLHPAATSVIFLMTLATFQMILRQYQPK